MCTPSSTLQSTSAPYRCRPCYIALSKSTAGHARTCPGSVRFRPQNFPPTRAHPGIHLTHGSLGQLSPYPKRHLDRFSRFCTAHGRQFLYFTMDRPFPLKIVPFTWGSGPHLTQVGSRHQAYWPRWFLESTQGVLAPPIIRIKGLAPS